jgi:hypothetical protein
LCKYEIYPIYENPKWEMLFHNVFFKCYKVYLVATCYEKIPFVIVKDVETGYWMDGGDDGWKSH